MANPDGGDTLDEVILCGIDVSKKLHTKYPLFPKDISNLATMAEGAMDAVAEAVGSSQKFEIKFHPRTYQSEAVLGKIENHNDEKADIVYDLDQNVCWRRFIITKEICHVLYHPNTDSHLTSTPEDVEQLLNKLMAGLDIAAIYRLPERWVRIYLAPEYIAQMDRCYGLAGL
jgi:hypothetical protein